MPTPPVMREWDSSKTLPDFELDLLRSASLKFQNTLSVQWAVLQSQLLAALNGEVCEALRAQAERGIGRPSAAGAAALAEEARLRFGRCSYSSEPKDPEDDEASRQQTPQPPRVSSTSYEAANDDSEGEGDRCPASRPAAPPVAAAAAPALVAGAAANALATAASSREGGVFGSGGAPTPMNSLRSARDGRPSVDGQRKQAIGPAPARTLSSLVEPSRTRTSFSDDDGLMDFLDEDAQYGHQIRGNLAVGNQTSMFNQLAVGNQTSMVNRAATIESDIAAWTAKKHTVLNRRPKGVSGSVDMTSFSLHPLWRQAPRPGYSRQQSGESMRWWNNVNNLSDDSLEGPAFTESVQMANMASRLNQASMVHPNSPRRWLWVSLGLLLICWDVVILPPEMAGLIPALPWLKTVEWFVFGYWVLDIPLNFRTGYHDDGIVDMRPRRVASRYMRGWFLCDLMIILIDCVLLVSAMFETRDTATEASESSVTFVRLGRTLRALRMLRLFRLLRLGKLLLAFSNFLDRLTSEFTLMLLKVGRLIVFIMVLNHYIACGWFAIGNADDLGPQTWIGEVGQDRLYLYLSAYHWAVTQFTPATQDIRPTNIGERGYATGVVLVALVTFSSFLGKMTSAMTQLLNINAAKTQEETKLRRFFHDYHITPQLRKQIWQCYRKQSETLVKRLRITDVDYFALMPERLQTQLRMQLYMQNLKNVPIFTQTLLQNSVEVAALCKLAVSEQVGGPLQEIFTAGMDAVQAISICHGSMLYNSHMLKDAVSVSIGEWVTEAALWGTMKHQGLLRSCVACHWMAINAHEFRVVMRRVGSDQSLRLVQRYAKKFEAYAQTTVILDILYDETTREHIDAMVQAVMLQEHGGAGRRSMPSMVAQAARGWKAS